jgi:murein DD-endopeptidase MepM/ murein hydrolase activator NlpD
MKNPIDNFVLKEYPKGSVTQWFGENPELYKRFGLKYHNGIDIVSTHGSPIYSVCDGTVYVLKTDTSDGWGRHVRIRSEVKDGLSQVWTYGHLDTITVKKGQKIKAGEQLGTMGNTGFVQTLSGAQMWWGDAPDTQGTHLHLGLRIQRGEEVLNYDNGVKGSIDPRPLFESPDKQAKLIVLLQKLVALLKLKQKS